MSTADALKVKPPTLTKAPPAGRKFPCKACGAKLDFDPASRSLKCPYCGYSEAIKPAEGPIEEHDLEAYLKHHAGTRVTLEGRSEQVRCPGCGAVVLLEDKVATDRCPYCATHLENNPEAAEAMIPPESLLPFALEARQARAAFDGWIGTLWFAPTELKRLADLGQPAGVYVPFWTYDAMTYTEYSGQRGDNYSVTEQYTDRDAQGNLVTRTRTVIRTRWTPVSGEVQHFFDDVLICASKSMPDDMVGELVPWDMNVLEPFRPEYLSGFKTERYAVGLEEGFGRAKDEMAGTIQQLCLQDIGGDQQMLAEMHTRYLGVTFKHILLPVWLASYRYRNQLYQILVNARTGEVVGRRPYSVAKIVALIAAIVVAALLVWFLVARAGAAGPPPVPARPVTARESGRAGSRFAHRLEQPEVLEGRREAEVRVLASADADEELPRQVHGHRLQRRPLDAVRADRAVQGVALPLDPQPGRGILQVQLTGAAHAGKVSVLA
jgi:DNA-directed RNA polymerase subunit RPC12/RpoP